MVVSYQYPNKRTTGALERLNAKIHRAIIDEAHLKSPFCDRRKGVVRGWAWWDDAGMPQQ